LIKEQAKKDLWIVARAGSVTPNYYICSKYWCATDKIPILLEEYTSPTMRNGLPKMLVPSCPFCGEQNVYEREGKNIYAGYSKALTHPENFVLPCCFKSFDNLETPDRSVPIPTEGGTVSVEVTEEKPTPILKDFVKELKKIYSSRLLSSTTSSLDYCTYGIVLPQIDTLLGQSFNKYQTTENGKIKLVAEPHAFIRFGCSTDNRLKGQSFIQFLSYVIYMCNQIGDGVGITNYMCAHDMIEWICDTNRVKMARALEAAQYGTLITEFYDRGEPDPGLEGSSYTLEEFQSWMSEMKLVGADRSYVLRFFKAWNRFVRYIEDVSEPKDLRIWDGLLSVPGLFSKHGIVILRITRDSDGTAQIECPSMNISSRSRITSPSIVPIFYMKEQHIIEPLLYVVDKKLVYGALTPTVIEGNHKLTKLYKQYLEPIIGCGRSVEPIHVWAPSFIKDVIPTFGEFLDFLRNHKEYKIHSILREYTNRIVGVLFEEHNIKYYIPVRDDGTIDITLISSYDADSIPTPPIELLYALLIKLGKSFTGLLPIRLLFKTNAATGINTFVAINTKAMFQILFEPYQEGTKEPLIMDIKPIKLYQWQIDQVLLKKEATPSIELMNQIRINPDELLNESYQHLRLSFSNWLHRTKMGNDTLKQIELLRAARSYLPLYELRKRGDILLAGLVESWITTQGVHTEPKLLRDDCLLLEKGKCSGMCGIEEGMCKIHAPVYGTIHNPAKILSARLIDELLRTNEPAYEVLQKETHRVERLRPPTELTREGDTLIVSFDGRGDSSLYRQLKLEGILPTPYTAGFLYPEEVSAEKLGQEVGTDTGLPILWEEDGWTRSAELYDLKEGLEQFREQILNKLLIDADKTYIEFEEALEKERPGNFSWTVEDINILSKFLNVNIILTEKIAQTGLLKMNAFINSTEEDIYVIFDDTKIPLIYYHSEGADPVYYVTKKELPEDVQIGVDLRS